MPSNDIGIDLGTATVIIYDAQRGLLLKEPSVVAVDTRTGDIITAGSDAQQMLGRTPDRIRAAMPLSDGVISDFDMTTAMISYFIKKVYAGNLIKPRVVICVPSGVTEVESNAVVSAAASAGARKGCPSPLSRWAVRRYFPCRIAAPAADQCSIRAPR